jgi:hypothetical protein
MRLRALVAAIAIVLPGACLAQGAFVSVGGGLGQVTVNRDLQLQGHDDDDNNWVNEASVGYSFAKSAVIEVSIARGISESFIFGGEYEYEDERLMAGYSFDVGKRFAIIPQVGISYWDVTLSRGGFFSPVIRSEVSGDDWVWRLRGDLKFNELIRMYFSFADTNHDFGDLTLWSLGVKFQF